MRVREEVLNVMLADLISQRGLISIPEGVLRLIKLGRRLPDITVANLWGVRVVIEGRIGNAHSVRDSLFEDAKKRVEDGITPLCIAVLYPNDVKNTESLDALRDRLEQAVISVAVISNNGSIDWTDSTVDGLSGILRRSYELLAGEDVVLEAVKEVRSAIETCSESIARMSAAPQRIHALLGIPSERLQETDGIMKTCRIAALTLLNALIFHQVISQRETRVRPLGRIIGDKALTELLVSNWTTILTEIDYVPIFGLANEIVKDMRGTLGFDETLRDLCQSALRITGKKAALRHDLMGRIYHRLLADAKYFGAFYTSVSSATLLTNLAFPLLEDIDWSDIESISQLRVADLACGTGTLLKAALHEIVDNYVQASVQKKKKIDLESLHQSVLQDCIWGFDVVPFAIHLAASSMAIHQPEVLFQNLRLYTLPLGILNEPRLGSLDFLTNRHLGIQADLLGSITAPGRITGAGEESQSVEAPLLDLCIMNPPFTRSVGGNLLFGNAPETERHSMQKELRRVVNKHRVNANVTAGLGSVFVALGAFLAKPKGVLALVLPRALLTGIAWGITRDLIAKNYHITHVVVSHEPGNWNFSESTKLSECLIVAKRLEQGKGAGPTKFVNLWIRPKNNLESLAVGNAVQKATGVDLETDLGTEALTVEKTKFGELITRTIDRSQTQNWGLETAFAQTDLCRVAYHLARGRIYLPGKGVVGEVPLSTLEGIGQLGFDRRDIHDGFEVSNNPTAYPAIWGHDTESIRWLFQEPGAYLNPLAKARPRRHLKNPTDLWSSASRLLIAERLRLTTTRLFTIIVSRPVLSNTWWTFNLDEADPKAREEMERILALWLNSTLGIISIVASRVETEGSWIDLKKPILASMPVLNPCMIQGHAKEVLADAYDVLRTANLRRLPEIVEDDVRAKLDSAILVALRIKQDIRVLRESLSIEPIISGILPI